MEVNKGTPTYKGECYVDVKGSAKAQFLAKRMIERSTFFTVEPFPNDIWRFFVKKEAGQALRKLAQTYSLTLQKARAINKACCAHVFKQMELIEEDPPSLRNYSLLDLIEAKEALEQYNWDRTDSKLESVCDDRLLAALYVVYNYPGQDPNDIEDAICVGNGTAVITVKVSGGKVK